MHARHAHAAVPKLRNSVLATEKPCKRRSPILARVLLCTRQDTEELMNALDWIADTVTTVRELVGLMFLSLFAGARLG